MPSNGIPAEWSLFNVAYVPMAVDYVDSAHIRIIKEAQKLGTVVIGVLTDAAIASYKRPPISTYEQRKALLESIAGVSGVVPEDSCDYIETIKKMKPAFLVHGDDWTSGQLFLKDKIRAALDSYGGKLVEVPSTKDATSVEIENLLERGVTPEYRMKKLRRLIETKPIVRILEAHNGLSALVAEKAHVMSSDGELEFDGIWESSLTDSASKGKPDIEVVDFTSRVQTINQILEVTTKPMIVDGDTGGIAEHFVHMVKTLERLGVSAIIIEDKVFPKRNSLLEGAEHVQEDVDRFCEKIRAGKRAQITKDFMVIARIESLIANSGIQDALMRAKAYIAAGADGIMIHSKEKSPGQVLQFCAEYRKFERRVPLVAVPTTYNSITEEELAEAGVSVVIYANHLLRSTYMAMQEVAEKILKYQRSLEADPLCYPVSKLLELIPIA